MEFIICIPATMFGLASLISTPATEKYSFACIHICEMTTMLVIITIFAYNQFDCGMCADSEDRQANANRYIKLFIIVGWVTGIIDFILYGILLCGNVFDDEDMTGPFEVFLGGMDVMKENTEQSVEMHNDKAEQKQVDKKLSMIQRPHV